jgi:hypothetical protein
MTTVTDLARTSGTSPPKLGRFPADLFGYKPKPQRAEPTCRYYITQELASAYSEEQLALQVERLKARGRWHPPIGRYTIRTSMLRPGVVHFRDERPPGEGYVEFEPEDREPFCDYHMDGETFIGATHLERCQFKVSNQVKKGILVAMTGKHNEPFPFYDYSTRKVWWERGHWLCDQVDYDPNIEYAPSDYHAQAALDLLVVILHDRNTLKVEAQPRVRSENLRRAKLNEQQPADVQTITLYCPGRISNADGTTSHASPKMHYRAEHTRNQPYGPRSNPQYREIVIAAQWINAADVDPSELSTPNRLVRLTAGGA